MKIGIDARFYGPTGKGLGRYTQKLIENLEKICDENPPLADEQACASNSKNQYFIFLKKENFDEYQPRNANFKKILADFRWYTFAEQLKMPNLIRQYKLDLVHFPHFNVPVLFLGKFVITIHDLILLHYPTIRNTTLHWLFYIFKYLAYRLVIFLAIWRAERIIAVSNATEKDILEHYGVRPEKITVTYEACDNSAPNEPPDYEAVLQKYGLQMPNHDILKYIIYVGNVYPHKNPEGLIRGFDGIKKDFPELRLVFVGEKDYFYCRLKKFAEDEKVENIIFTGKVNDAELAVILRFATLYARPSFYEGFELPPLEAMAAGIPVICSDHNSAREILGNAAFYFNPNNFEDITKAIKTILNDKDLQLRLVRAGFKQVKKYSWKKMAGETLKIYNTAIK